jgi:hypothetical protein
MRTFLILMLAMVVSAAEPNPFVVTSPSPVVEAPAAPVVEAPAATAPAVVSGETASHSTQPALPSVPSTQPAQPEAWWVGVLATLASLFGLWLRKKINAFTSAHIAKADAEAEVAGIDAKQRLVSRAKAYIWRCVGNYNEKHLPDLCEAISRGQIKDVEEVKERLRGLGVMMLADVVEYFKLQDIDVLKEIGEVQINSLIRSAVDELSPFQKYPTAKALVTGGAELIVKYGLNVGAGKFAEYLNKQADADIAKLAKRAGSPVVTGTK